MTSVGGHEGHTRDEVLARLLELDEDRAEEERLTGQAAAHSKKATKSTRKKTGGRKKRDVQGQMNLSE